MKFLNALPGLRHLFAELCIQISRCFVRVPLEAKVCIDLLHNLLGLVVELLHIITQAEQHAPEAVMDVLCISCTSLCTKAMASTYE